MNIMTGRKRGILAAAVALSLIVSLPIIPVSASASTAAEYSEEGATYIEFSDDGITVNEGEYDGYKVSGTELTLKDAGTYIVSGECADGSIKVKKGTEGVTLVLDGLSLISSDTAPITCAKSSEVVIAAADGTVNSLTDSAQNNDDNYPDNANAENAVIKCKDGSNVTLCGSGELKITALGKNGIKSGMTTEEEGDASLTIRDITLDITASVNDAVNAEQLLNIESGSITIDAGDDALHCDVEMNVGADGTAGPSITINECCEGLEAATLNIYSGYIDITASDDCLNAANSDLTDYDFSMNIYGGTIIAYSTTGDGFDSNGSLTITGGNIVVMTASTADNQPLDADGKITISGGTVFAAGGSGGMRMDLTSSQPYVVYGSSVMGGGPQGGGQPGQVPDGQPAEPPQNGDFGDGQAPSGQLEPPQNGETGGMTPPSGDPSVNAPSGDPSGNAPSGDFSGGAPGNMGGSTLAAAGSTVTVSDSAGNAVYSVTADCDLSFVFFTSPDLESGAEYTLASDGSDAATATAQTGAYTNSGAQPQFPDRSADEQNDTTDTVTAPQTSDGSHIVLLSALLALSAAVFGTALVCRRLAAKKSGANER